jgi:hypothetical protein
MCKHPTPKEQAPNPESILTHVGTNFKDFAKYCGSGRAAREILRERDYHTFNIAKKNTTETREIEAPNSTLKMLQRQMLNLLETLPINDAAHGFVKGRSNKTAADYIAKRMGIAKATFLGTDLRKAFPTVSRARIRELLKTNFPTLTKWQLHVMARICCRGGKLATGSPCSPIILNLCAQAMDEEIISWTKRNGGKFIRYADDCVLVIYSHTKHRIRAAKKFLRRTITKHGFIPHPEKNYTTRIGIDANHGEIVGLRVANNEVKTFRKFRRKVRALRHQLQVRSQLLPSDHQFIKTLLNRLAGMYNYMEYSSRPPTRHVGVLTRMNKKCTT